MNVLNSYDGSFISEKDSPILWCGLFFKDILCKKE